MPMVPDDEQCIQQMLGILDIAPEIEQEYMVWARMLHRQLAGGPIGPIAIVAMLRSLGIGPPPAQILNEEGRVDWRQLANDTPVEVKIDGEWQSGEHSFAGEIGGGTVAINVRGRIDEFNSFDVRIPAATLPSDVDAESFKGEVERDEGDARARLIATPTVEETTEAIKNGEVGEYAEEEATDTEPEAAAENEVEIKPPKGDIGADDEVPPNIGVKVNWGQVKKKTEIWYRDGEDMHDAIFHRVVAPDKALILVNGEEDTREVERAFLKLP